MPSEHRTVTVEHGHEVRVYRDRQPATRPGHVRVRKSHRAPFEITLSVWEAGRR